MTVRYLKELIKDFNDDDRIIIDNGDRFEATEENEIIYAYKHKRGNDPDWAPVVVLQTRDCYDVEGELEASLEHYEEENWDEADALAELFEMGYTVDDFDYDEERYKWAKRVAKEHGLI